MTPIPDDIIIRQNEETISSQSKQSEGSNPYKSTRKLIFAETRVNHCKVKELKIKLQTLIRSKGMSEPEFYTKIGLSRQVWYYISWGVWEPTLDQKIKIARALDTDSSVIW